MDLVPGLSQVKSLVQYLCNDENGAKQTQENFLKGFPVLSQGTSLFQWISGDAQGALETQKQFGKVVNAVVNSVPVVGHVKGAIHYACGDKKGGDNAMKASSRTTLVIGGGVGGFLVGGPVGAAVGGMAGGATADSTITAADVLINGKGAEPYGLIATINQIEKNPKNGGLYVDLVGGLAMDSLAGYSAGEGLGRKIDYKIKKSRIVQEVGEDGARQIVDVGESMRKTHSRNKIRPNKPYVETHVTDKVLQKTYKGYNKQMRKQLGYREHMTHGPTELQNRVPEAQLGVLDRNPVTCAEQQAYSGVYQGRPDVQPADLRSATVRWDKNRGPITARRCGNCRSFGSQMGDVVTDKLPEGTAVPARVSAGKVTSATAEAIVEGSAELAPAFEIPISDTEVAEGEDIVLECRANTQYLKVRWEKDGQELCHGGRIRVSRKGKVLRLRIRHAGHRDGGTYTVKLSNGKGVACSSAQVSVLHAVREASSRTARHRRHDRQVHSEADSQITPIIF